MSNNVVWHSHPVDQQTRAEQKQQKPLVIWFTGLSASGKSTIAGALEQILTQQGYHDDRKENIRRVGEVAKLGADSGLIVLAAFISPFREDRRLVRDILPEDQFVEVFVDAPLALCQLRDPKGLYAKVERGEIKSFTGIDSPYETPEAAEVHIDAAALSVAESINQLLEYLHQSGVLKAGYQPVAVSA